ncbi:MAG: NAD(+) synthase [Deltaproteobacteria bacterium]|nr:NAD(+) synthase [Deltaproteobacteria bacterium]
MIKDIAAVSHFLEKSVRDFTDLAVIGTSGGVDSSVVASICVAALGTDHVHLVSMPYDQVDVTTFNARSAELATRLRAHHHIVPVGDSCRALEKEIQAQFPNQSLQLLTKANIRPRVRMNALYSICGELSLTSKKRVRVMGTGHLSEDLIGYDTKGGDALADIFILSDLVKSEVYQLAEHYGVPSSITEAPPSAGLYADQTDFGELGFTYDELEQATLALYHAIKRGLDVPQIHTKLPEFDGLEARHVDFVVSRYKTHFHKHRAPVTVDCRNPHWFGEI